MIHRIEAVSYLLPLTSTSLCGWPNQIATEHQSWATSSIFASTDSRVRVLSAGKRVLFCSRFLVSFSIVLFCLVSWRRQERCNTYGQSTPFAFPAGQAFAAPAGFAATQTFRSSRQVALPPVVGGSDVVQGPPRGVARGLATIGQRPVLTFGVHMVVAHWSFKMPN